MPGNRLLVAALCALSLFAQDRRPPEEAAALSGVVTNALSGDPLFHAHVIVRPVTSGPGQLQYGALSDGGGKFSIARIPPGRYRVFVEKPSYTAGSMPQELTLGRGEKQTGLQLKLVPGGVITGRVLDPKGEPMENVRVGVMTGASSVTDEEGRYRIGGLAPGRQRLVAATMSMPMPAEHRTDGTQEPHYARTFYPSSLNSEGAQWVPVRAGAETAGVDIRMVRVPVLTISGRAVGVPIGTRLQLRSRSQFPNLLPGAMTQLRPDGTFEIWSVSPGKYWLQAGTTLAGESLQSVPLPVDVESTNIRNLEVKVLPPQALQGVVRWEGPAPRDTASPDSQAAPGAQLVFSSTAGAGGFGGGNLSAVVAADGTFSVQRIQPGKYNLRYSDPRGFVKSIRLGARDSQGSALDLSNGSAGAQIIVTLSSAVANLSGVVRKGGQPVEGIGVMLVDGESIVSRVSHQARSGADGSYRIIGVPPGTYRLLVGAPEELTASMGMLGTLESHEVTLAAGENATRDLRYAPGSEPRQ